MKKTTEVSIIVAGGAIGGLVSVMEAWADPTLLYFSFAHFFALFLMPVVKGGIAAGIGVYVLTSHDAANMAKVFFFSVTCGLAFPSILAKGGSMAENAIDQTAQAAISHNTSVLNDLLEANNKENPADIAKIKNASEKIILAHNKTRNADHVNSELAINNALSALGSEAANGDANAINALVEISKLSSQTTLPLSVSEHAVKELNKLRSNPSTRVDIKRKTEQAIIELKQNHIDRSSP